MQEQIYFYRWIPEFDHISRINSFNVATTFPITIRSAVEAKAQQMLVGSPTPASVDDILPQLRRRSKNGGLESRGDAESSESTNGNCDFEA